MTIPDTFIVSVTVTLMALVLCLHVVRGCITWVLACERRGHDRCSVCGYDLRAQVRPRCPECGEAMIPWAPNHPDRRILQQAEISARSADSLEPGRHRG